MGHDGAQRFQVLAQVWNDQVGSRDDADTGMGMGMGMGRRAKSTATPPKRRQGNSMEFIILLHLTVRHRIG
jgi:hypothetical protein